ncbi:MAG: DUF2721 domain-containing protein, partial [Wenzhouxiangellaceae bacterium]|nr:DUF2721 domain-containing protein [Wenzhouxiangellaceae bacterium]MBS3824817.1 DUF2721 domain-containing protein [Wenzhouxiangellaceae bacterium]
WMNSLTSIDAVTGIIQASLTPVFLLVAIGSFLNVLSVRLGRIIDRKRAVGGQLGGVADAGLDSRMAGETARLRRRSGLILWSIRLCVSSAVSICIVVVALFLDGLATAGLGLWIAGLFMLAMLLITGGLACLLVEVGMAARQVQQTDAG